MSHEFFSVGCHSVTWGRHLPVPGEIHHTEPPVEASKVHIHLAKMHRPFSDVHILSLLRKEGRIPGRIEVLDVVCRMGFDPLKGLLHGLKSPVSEINIACLGSFVANGSKKEGIVYKIHDCGVELERFMIRDTNSCLPVDWFFPAVDPMSA